MTIHKEGRFILPGLLLVLILINWLAAVSVPGNTITWLVSGASLILFVLVLQFFRSPVITVTEGSAKILAPADGKVVAIEETDETEFLNGRRRQISIFMSPLNVHINRMPTSGEIVYIRYHPGKYLVAWHPKSSTENERMTIVARRSDGIAILFRQIAGAMARRIKLYIKEGDQLTQGAEFGFIRFGSRVDVFLPLDAKVSVGIGDKTTAGVTVIGEVDQPAS